MGEKLGALVIVKRQRTSRARLSRVAERHRDDKNDRRDFRLSFPRMAEGARNRKVYIT